MRVPMQNCYLFEIPLIDTVNKFMIVKNEISYFRFNTVLINHSNNGDVVF